MAYFKQSVFGGEAPAIDPELLPDNYGQLALDADYSSGKAVTLAADQSVTLNGTNTLWTSAATLYQYKFGSNDPVWLSFRKENVSGSLPTASIVPGPIPDDTLGRIYFTGYDSADANNANNQQFNKPGRYPKITWNQYIDYSDSTDYKITNSNPNTNLSTGIQYGGIISQITPRTDTDFNQPHIFFRLGVPKPSGTLLATPAGGTDTGEITTVAYAMTYVTVDGREGPPLISNTVELKADRAHVTLVHTRAPFVTPAGGAGTDADRRPNDGLNESHAINRIRMYKSQTGSESTQFQFLYETEVFDKSNGTVKYPTYLSATLLNDTLDIPLAEVLPSADWIGPPDDDTGTYPDGPMQGLCSIGQGIMAGFAKRRLCFSVPFVPHAWPVAYRTSVAYDIVAIKPCRGGLVVLTTGTPYFVYGNDPTTMALTQIDFQQPCINPLSVVLIRDIVYYASPEGLCAISGTQGTIVTADLINRDQWNPYEVPEGTQGRYFSLDLVDVYKPDEYTAFNFRDTYVAFPPDPDDDGFAFDPFREDTRLTSIGSRSESYGSHTLEAYYEDPEDSDVYFIKNSNTNLQTIMRYRAGEYVAQVPVHYKSKVFVTPKPVSMRWLSVDSDRPYTVSVFADGIKIYEGRFTLTSTIDTYSNQTIHRVLETPSVPAGLSAVYHPVPTGSDELVTRLPAVFASKWEVEIKVGMTTAEMTALNIQTLNNPLVLRSFCLAETTEEIKGT